jgi:hypothetical protein
MAVGRALRAALEKRSELMLCVHNCNGSGVVQELQPEALQQSGTRKDAYHVIS